jgi:hypothetical protein|tara:strand:- start:605 stop:1072 length:468 start_codon:yes stop_codon:yes gene_type:complete
MYQNRTQIESVSKMINVSKSNTNQVGEQMTTTHSNIQRRCRRNEKFVNSLKMQTGCFSCHMKPTTEAECRLLDLNHDGGGSVGAWAKKSTGKTADVARLVWSGASLQRIADEIAKGDFLCKNCHCLEHTAPPVRLQETEEYAVKEIENFLKKDRA